MRRLLAVCLVLLVPLASVQAKNIWRLTDINPGPGGSGASYLTLYDGDLYFRANDLPHGDDIELWRYDPAAGAASRAADICPGPEGSWMADLVVYSNALYFRAEDGTHGTQMWTFSGTTASPVTNFAIGTNFPEGMTSYGGYLIYDQAGSFPGSDLYRYDGTSQTPINAVGGGKVYLPQFFTEYNGLLYFSAGSGVGGAELWRTNGTAAAQLTEIRAGNGGDPRNLCVYDGDLYFSAFDGVHGNELWKFDGANATLVKDLLVGGQYASGNPSGMTVYNGKMYFNAYDPDHGFELWAYDSATDVAAMVVEINPTPDPLNGDDFLMDSSPHDFIVYEDVLYFVANDGSHGNEIWSWDGAEAELEFDIMPGLYSSEPRELLVVGDSVYLSADDGIHGDELWRMQFPEPATLAMLGLGVLGVLARRRAPKERP